MKIFKKKLILAFSRILIILFLFLALFYNLNVVSADVEVNFGINNSQPWVQTKDSDVRVEGDGSFVSGGTFTNPLPGSPSDSPAQYCNTNPNIPNGYYNSYTSLQGEESGTPGIVFTGNNDYDFGARLASRQSPPDNFGWVVGGSFPAPLNTQLSRKTSYSYIYSKARQGGLTPIALETICSDLGNCDLAVAITNGTFTHGLYNASGNLKLTGGEVTFSQNQNFVILVDGDLLISTEIKVNPGSTAVFVVKGDITVDKSIGESDITSTNTNLEGMYSADNDFIIDGYHDCSAHGSDLRLNLAGNVVTGAGGSSGSLVNNRDLCDGNLICPVFFVSARPDFLLNLPTLMRYSNYTWQEIAP